MHGRNGCACCRSLLLLMCAVVTILLYGTPLALGNEIAESVGLLVQYRNDSGAKKRYQMALRTPCGYLAKQLLWLVS